jgi:hypothetical protein
MPKFMTYQRPVPVNKTAWAGRPGANVPGRKAKAARTAPEQQRPRRPALLPADFKSP